MHPLTAAILIKMFLFFAIFQTSRPHLFKPKKISNFVYYLNFFDKQIDTEHITVSKTLYDSIYQINFQNLDDLFKLHHIFVTITLWANFF